MGTPLSEEQTGAGPTFSLQERDRRWSLVREAMERENVDCLITPNNSGHSGHFQAESRYLTRCGGDADIACVFPLEGEVTLIATRCENWRETQDWVSDLREAHGAHGQTTAQRLREVTLPRRRVGIVGLGGYVRAPEGIVLHGFMQALTEAFPAVEWVDFTNQLQGIRMVKSDEEVGFLARSTELVERAIRRIEQVARPGIKDYEVWGAMIGEICKGGSELPFHTHWGSGIRPTTLTRPTHGTLHRGHLIVNEIEAAFGGYHAQGVQPFAIQDCDVVYKDLYAMHADYWQRCFEEVRIGRTVGEVDEQCRAFAAAILPVGSRYAKPSGRLAMHGRGLGSDAPLVTGSGRGEATMAQVFAPGWAFVFKPNLQVDAANRRYSAGWGDTVVMTEQGPRRLGSRPPGLIITGVD